MVRAGAVRKGSKKDVHHVNRNTADNRRSNLRVTTRRANRSYRRK